MCTTKWLSLYTTPHTWWPIASLTWFKWLTEVHIPNMLGNGSFTSPQIAKVLTEDKEQEGVSVSVQFLVNDLITLQLWEENDAELVQNDLASRFGTEVLSFSTVLELF